MRPSPHEAPNAVKPYLHDLSLYLEGCYFRSPLLGYLQDCSWSCSLYTGGRYTVLVGFTAISFFLLILLSVMSDYDDRCGCDTYVTLKKLIQTLTKFMPISTSARNPLFHAWFPEHQRLFISPTQDKPGDLLTYDQVINLFLVTCFRLVTVSFFRM